MQVIRQLLSEFKPSGWGYDLLSAGFIERIESQGDGVHIHLRIPFAGASWLEELKAELDERIRQVADVHHVWWHWQQDVATLARASAVPGLSGIRNIIAVASGKGGVGKSTVAVNLALALRREGARVGLLDADIYGPSIPLMLGSTKERPASHDGKQMQPISVYGIVCNSIGFLVPESEATVWRGPMASKALSQILHETRWGELDYLIVDMPPGTGDTQLTLAQKVPVTGAVIVTTPQDIALIDARKGLKMFEKVGIPILGLIENMSVHICSNCGHAEHIFGSGGAQKMKDSYGVELLGALPLELAIRELADAGKPTVIGDPTSKAAEIYKAIARKIAAKIAERAKDMSAKFPNIVVQNT